MLKIGVKLQIILPNAQQRSALLAINVKVVNKSYNIGGPYVMSEVEYLWNGSVKKNGVNANLVLHDCSNFRYHH